MPIALQKEDCCGCGSCHQACPAHCIDLREDTEGFLYPHVDRQKCLGCESCVRVCPALNLHNKSTPLFVAAAKATERENLSRSSSGGVFPSLAQTVIREGGIVFGACFDQEWNVVHSSADSTDGIRRFYSSKYVQSDIRRTFIETREFLNKGRTVLFSGTPCQIAALKTFLGKESGPGILYTVDVICHGVPSPLIWQQYLRERFADKKRITDVQFRSKRYGWLDFSLRIRHRRTVCGMKISSVSDLPNDEDPFMLGFLNDLVLRPSCYRCKYKCGRSGSDITLGDCWEVRKIAPDFYSSQGVSNVLCNTKKGQELLRRCDLVSIANTYAEALKHNPTIEQSVTKPPARALFWENIDKGISLSSSIQRALPVSRAKTISTYLKNRMKRVLRLIGG